MNRRNYTIDVAKIAAGIMGLLIAVSVIPVTPVSVGVAIILLSCGLRFTWSE